MSQISHLAISQPTQSAIQNIDNFSASDGYFQCLFDEEATTQLAWNISAADLQTALQGLTTIGSGNVAVASVGIDRVFTIIRTSPGTAGTFSINYTGAGSGSFGAIPYNATVAQLQSAFNGVFGPDAVVSGSDGGPWTVTLTGVYAPGASPGSLYNITISPATDAAYSITTTGGSIVYQLTFQGALTNLDVPKVLVCGSATSSTIISYVVQRGSVYGGYFDPSTHNPTIVNYPNFGMYTDNTQANFVTANGTEVKYWLDACGSGNAWQQTGTSTFAQFTVTPAETASSGTYTLTGPISFQAGQGMTLTSGTVLTKTGGSNLTWDGAWISNENYTNAAYVSWRASQTTGFIMLGLSSNLSTTTDTYRNIDYAWYAENGVCYIFEGGSLINSYGSYTTSTLFSIIYDGTNVSYYLDGALIRQISRAVGAPLHLYSAAYNTGGAAFAIAFGNVFAPSDTPVLSGWTQTAGTTYNAGAFTFTSNITGSKIQPVCNDSKLTNAWDGSVSNSSPGFIDGTDPTAAVQVLQYNAGSFDPPIGNWSLGDWTGDVSGTPTPTGWSVSGGLAGLTATRTVAGSGQSPLSWDTSGLIGQDSNPWDGSLSQVSFADGTDGLQATQYFALGSAGTHAPSGGTWTAGGSAPVAYSTYPSITGWTIYGGSPGHSITDIYASNDVIYLSNGVGSGQSPLTVNTSSITIGLIAQTPSFTNGINYSPTYLNGDLDFTQSTEMLDGSTTISGLPFGSADRTILTKVKLLDWTNFNLFVAYGGTFNAADAGALDLCQLRHRVFDIREGYGWVLQTEKFTGLEFGSGITPDTNFHSFVAAITNGDYTMTTNLYLDGTPESYALWGSSPYGTAGTLNTTTGVCQIGAASGTNDGAPIFNNFICRSVQIYKLFLGNENITIIG